MLLGVVAACAALARTAGAAGLCAGPGAEAAGGARRDNDYDVVIMTSERESAFYVCETLSSVLASARFSNIMVAFSGAAGEMKAALHDRCSELKAIRTAVMSPSSLASSEEGAARVLDELKDAGASAAAGAPASAAFAGADLNTTPTRARLLRLIREKLNYRNALKLGAAAAGGQRALLVLEDDVLLSHDFDEKVRCAQAEASAAGGAYVISAYHPGEMTTARVSPSSSGGTTTTGRRLAQYSASAGKGRSPRLLKRKYYYGSQALLFSPGALLASEPEGSIVDRFERLARSPTAGDVFSLPDEIVKGWAASARGRASGEEVRVYTVIRSIVQHVGRQSTLFSDASTGTNTRFHQAPGDLEAVWLRAEEHSRSGITQTTVEYD